VAGAEREGGVAFDCTLEGEVNPEGVPDTEVWFQWGSTPSLGQSTPKQSVATGNSPVPIQVTISGDRPNESYYYRLVAEDENDQAPEAPLSSETRSFKTSAVAPDAVAGPGAEFVKSSSAVLVGEVNPENANTRYEFQYVPYAACESLEESCPGMAETGAQESAAYGKLATTLEATALQPATTYRYRLFAVNAVNGAHQTAVNETGGLPLPEGTFKTAPAPVPQAVTGAYSALSATSASISGLVNPDGQAATYAFELGVYNPGGTQFGIVSSGAAGSSTGPVEESLQLTGLQPGTTYAYRISVHSGYGEASGETMTFTTEGLPSVLEVPGVLGKLTFAHPPFPSESTVKTRCKKGFRLDKSHKCVATRKKRKLGRHKAKKKK
jgi:phosphodiesterase/alkaline phosphatase D-like protein